MYSLVKKNTSLYYLNQNQNQINNNTNSFFNQLEDQNLKINNHTLTIYFQKNKNNNYYNIISTGYNNSCFILRIDTETNVASLNIINKSADCFNDESYDNSRDIVRAAYIIAKKKGCIRFELTDNSKIYCVPGKNIVSGYGKDKDKIYLSDLYFLSTGKTWYESILKNLKPVKNIQLIEKNRIKVLTNTWDNVDKKLKNKFGIFYNFNVKNISTDKIGSAIKVLKQTINEKIHCEFFSKHMSELLLASKIISLHGSDWFIDIK